MAAASIAEQIAAACLSLLQTPGALPAGTNCERARETPWPRDFCPAVVIESSTENTTSFADDADRNELEIGFRIMVRADPWEPAADLIAVAIHAAIPSGLAQSGLIQDLRRLGREWQAKEADVTAGELVCKYLVTYLSSAADITSPPLI